MLSTRLRLFPDHPTWPAIAYSTVDTRTPSAVPSSSNSPTAHLGLELALIAQSYRPFSSSPLGGPTQVARRKLRPSSAAVATSREGHHSPRSGRESQHPR